jgi:hypothetical protein
VTVRPLLRLAVLLAALSACNGSDPAVVGTVTPVDTGGTGRPTLTGSSPRALPVLGQGAVTARYSGEVSVRPLAGDYAYMSSWGSRSALGNVVGVWDVRGDRPVLTDSLVIDRTVTANVTTTGDVQVSDDDKLLVVATEPVGSLVLYSLADPAHPRFLRTFTSPNVSNGVHTAQVSRVNGRVYVFASVDPRGGSPARLTVVDITDPEAPREVWSQTMGNPFVHDVFVRDGVLFAAIWNDGVALWDIGGLGRGGSVAAPMRVGVMRTVATDPASGASVHNVWWLHQGGAKRYLLVGEELTTGVAIGNSSAGDIHVVDVGDLSDPGQWHEVAAYRVNGAGTHNFSVDEARGVLYAAYYGGGVRALDVRGDLGTCTTAQRFADGRCDLTKMGREIGVALDAGVTTTDPRNGVAYEPFVWGVEYRDGLVYASDMLGGLWKLRGLTP